MHFNDDESKTVNMINKLSRENLIPSNINIWMNTIRKLRNEGVHEDEMDGVGIHVVGIDKNQAFDALGAALNVAEWYMKAESKMKMLKFVKQKEGIITADELAIFLNSDLKTTEGF